MILPPAWAVVSGHQKRAECRARALYRAATPSKTTQQGTAGRPAGNTGVGVGQRGSRAEISNFSDRAFLAPPTARERSRKIKVGQAIVKHNHLCSCSAPPPSAIAPPIHVHSSSLFLSSLHNHIGNFTRPVVLESSPPPLPHHHVVFPFRVHVLPQTMHLVRELQALAMEDPAAAPPVESSSTAAVSEVDGSAPVVITKREYVPPASGAAPSAVSEKPDGPKVSDPFQFGSR